MIKLNFLDTETTGLDSSSCGIWSLSGVLAELDEDAKVIHLKDSYDLYMRPFEGAKVDSKALKVGGISLEDFEEFEDQKVIFARYKKLLKQYVDPYDKKDKYNFLAYNSPFDNSFMRSWWFRNHDKYFGSYFWTPDICIMRQAAQYLIRRRIELPNFKLATVAEFLGFNIEDTKLHSSMYDNELALYIYATINGYIIEGECNGITSRHS